ncbi:lactonase family protein [Rhizobium herbae]
MADLEFYLGTYTASPGGGIHHVRLPGALPDRAEIRLVAEARSPSWIAALPNSRILLAVEEVEESDRPQLLTFRLGQGRLTRTGATALPGSHPCHIGVHSVLPLAVTAHYSDGSAALWHIAPDTGTASLLQRLQLSGNGPNMHRQEGSHAHFATFIEDGGCLATTDLGGDAVHFFQLEMGDRPKLVTRQRLGLPSGSGPRHLVAGSDRLYLVCELDEKIYMLDRRDGVYRVAEALAPFGTAAVRDGSLSALKLSPDGRFLYVAGRNQSAVAWMAVAPSGDLHLCGQIDCGGHQPRDIAIDPSGQWLIVANQSSDSLSLFRLDQHSGAPERIAGTINISSPACILYPDGWPTLLMVGQCADE